MYSLCIFTRPSELRKEGLEVSLLWLVVIGFIGWSMPGHAAPHVWEMTIEDTKLTLVGNTQFHTFAFNGQVPGPLIHVQEGDQVTVNVTNLTSLPHTIHWHGIL